MKVYTVRAKYKSDDLGDSWAFEAKNQKDADSKIRGLNRYQGRCDEAGWGWEIAVITDKELPIKNNWVARF